MIRKLNALQINQKKIRDSQKINLGQILILTERKKSDREPETKTIKMRNHHLD